jgi:translation initiation factor IF-2
MQAAPPPEAQVLPESGETTPGGARPAAGRASTAPAARPAAAPEPPHPAPTERIDAVPQPAPFWQAPAEPGAVTSGPMPDADVSGATMIPRRPVIEGAARSRADVPWLGIGSWLLLCGALFASLVGWPDQTALDRVTSLWSSEPPSASVDRTPAQGEPTPAQGAPASADQQDWSAMTPGPGHEQETLPPTELAPPIQSEAPGGVAEPAIANPPLPRFKPSVDRVAAEFSNAFFEFGDRLQQQGDFDAAIHMRRQGTNLWRSAGASDL